MEYSLDETDESPLPIEEYNRPPWWRTRQGLLIGLGFIALLVATRLVDLGRQSPWNDEVCNWMWALEMPAGAVPSHPLTYWLIKISTGINDSVYFLRLPMAIMMISAGLMLFGMMWRHLTDGVAGTFAVLFALSPMAIYYSQDANHYAALYLGGTVGLITVCWWWRTDWSLERLIGAVLALAFVALLYKAHPFAIFIVAGMGVALLGDLIRRPHQIPFAERFSETLMRRGIGGVAVVLAVIGAVFAFWRASQMHSTPNPAGVYFSLSPEFLGRLLADFFGAYYHHSFWDYILGICAFVLAIYGWVVTARRYPFMWGGILFLGSLIAAILLVFSIFEFTHSFHVRYIIFLLPGLLAGWAMGLSEALRGWGAARQDENISMLRPLLTLVCGVASVALLLGRLSVWGGAYYISEFQPADPAMKWIGQKTQSTAIVGTRSVYLAQSFRFLNQRNPEKLQRTYVWLGESLPYSRNARRLALYLEHLNPGNVFTLDMADLSEASHVDYARFVTNEAKHEVTFGSSVEKDFFAFDRSLVIRRVPHDPNFGKLPQIGSDAYQLYPMDAAWQVPFETLDDGKPPRQWLFDGSGATYFIRNSGAKPVVIDLLVNRVGKEGWLIGVLGRGDVVAWKLDTTREVNTVEMPIEWQTAWDNGDTLTLFFPRIAGAEYDSSTRPRVEVFALREKSTRDKETIPSWQVRATDKPQSLFMPVGILADRSFQQKQPAVGSNEDLAQASFSLEDSNTPRLVLAQAETRGLSSSALRCVVEWRTLTGEKGRLSLAGGYDTSSTLGRATFAAIIPPDLGATDLSATLGLIRVVVNGPHDGDVFYSQPVIGEMLPPK